jgi:hypothetical protein
MQERQRRQVFGVDARSRVPATSTSPRGHRPRSSYCVGAGIGARSASTLTGVPLKQPIEYGYSSVMT